jgi:transcriptional regulator with XRE-family HTH domain
MTFGKVLRDIREKRGSLRKVAKVLEIDFSYLSRLENDRLEFRPSREFLDKVVDKLCCDDKEKDILFSEARRMDLETEEAMEELHQRPPLKMLFKSAPKLTDTEIEEFNRRIESILKKKEK